MEYDIDPATGYEFFFWSGQKRFRCPEFWESGKRCDYDHYDPREVAKHAREPHTRDGKPKPGSVEVVRSSIVDPEGKPMTFERTVPEDVRGIRFRRD